MIERVPAELRETPQWIAWKSIGADKRKVPFDPNTARPAKAGDPATWAPLEKAISLFNRGGFAGLGFEFHDDPFVGIDLDGCRNPATKEIAPWAKKIILAIGSYAEVSPSQTGVKIFARGKSPFDGGQKKDIDTTAVSEKPPGIEIYDQQRYFAVTGWRLTGMDAIVDVEPNALRAIWDELPSKATKTHDRLSVVERAARYVAKCDPAIAGSSGHNVTFAVACSLVLGFCLTPEEALPIFSEWNQRCQPPWSYKDLIRKLHEANKQSGNRGYLRDGNEQQWEQHRTQYKPPAVASKNEPEDKSPQAMTLDKACYEYLATLGEESELDGTGLSELDFALDGGLARGELVLVAARPSHGKTMFAMQMIHHLSCKAPALIVSEEMTALALGKRTIQFASDVHPEYWFNSTERIKGELVEHFGHRQTCWVVESVRTANNAAETIRRMHAKHDIQFVAIDYVQMLAGRDGSRYESVTEASLTFRALANELGITLLVLAQLNRQIEKRDSFIPKLGDLKESGQLEQDADVVLFLVWPHRIDGNNPANEYQVFIAKNRNRAIVRHAVQCEFNPGRQKLSGKRVEQLDNYEDAFDAFK